MINQKILTEDLIFTKQNFYTQQEIFDFLGAKLVESNVATNAEAVVDALKEREKESTTGMLDGFAIPHGKSTKIRSATIVVIKNDNDIEWNSMDRKPIRIIIALFIPDQEKGNTHLKILSNISKMLMKQDMKEKIKGEDNPNNLYNIIKGYLDSLE